MTFGIIVAEGRHRGGGLFIKGAGKPQASFGDERLHDSRKGGGRWNFYAEARYLGQLPDAVNPRRRNRPALRHPQ